MAYPIEAFVDPNLSSRDAFLTGNWSDLLSDLGCMGPMWTLTSSTGIELDYRTDLTGIRVRQNMGLLSRPGHGLRLMLSRLHSIRAAADNPGPDNPSQISIEDKNRYPLLTLRPDSRDQCFLFRTLLRVHTDAGRKHRSAHESLVNLAPSANAGNQGTTALERLSRGICDGIDTRDVIELSGRTAFDPFQLRDRGRAVAVDPDLIACALEYLVDQVIPLRVVTGNDGIVQRLNVAFFAHSFAGAQQRLGGEGVSLRIDTRALYTAWVFHRAVSPSPPRELRLYDSDASAMAFIGVQPLPDGTEPPVWRTVMNALLA